MLETPQERVKLLKAGINGNTIEKLYLIYNNFQTVHIPAHFEMVEINIDDEKPQINVDDANERRLDALS